MFTTQGEAPRPKGVQALMGAVVAIIGVLAALSQPPDLPSRK